MKTHARCWAIWLWLGALIPSGIHAAQRVVSLDYCADQFVLKLLPRESIVALSPDSTMPFAYLRDEAVGLPQVRPVTENILALQPDLVVRSYGGGPQISGFLEKIGVPVIQLPFANSLADVQSAIVTVANGLGQPEKGQHIADEMQARLDRIPAAEDSVNALYMTPNGATSGPGTQVNDMLSVAGLENFEQRPGWWTIPLERLAYEQPDLVVGAFFDGRTDHPALWSSMRHPVAKRQMQHRPTVLLDGAWTACGGWFLIEAVEALAKARQNYASP